MVVVVAVGDWGEGGGLMVCGEFGAAIATVTSTESGSHWEARPPPEEFPVWQSLGFPEEGSYACNCPEGPVPMDTGQLLALGKEQSNVSSAWEVSSAQGAAEQRLRTLIPS